MVGIVFQDEFLIQPEDVCSMSDLVYESVLSPHDVIGFKSALTGEGRAAAAARVA